MNNRNEPQFENPKTELLNPETNYSVIRTFPPDMSSDARRACETIIRIREQMEKPLHRPKDVVKDDLSSDSPAEFTQAPTAPLVPEVPDATTDLKAIVAVKSAPAPSLKAKPKGKSRPNAAKKRRRSRARPRRRATPVEPSNNDLAHEARCSICQNDFRADIEEEFTHWHSPENIAYDYRVSMRSLYRHARHKNLFAHRDRNLRYALGHVIDRAERIPVMTPESIIRAVHAFARINNEGQWVEPPKHVIFSTAPSVAAQAAEAFKSAISIPADPHPSLNPSGVPGNEPPGDLLLLPAPSDSPSLRS